MLWQHDSVLLAYAWGGEPTRQQTSRPTPLRVAFVLIRLCGITNRDADAPATGTNPVTKSSVTEKRSAAWRTNGGMRGEKVCCLFLGAKLNAGRAQHAGSQ